MVTRKVFAAAGASVFASVGFVRYPAGAAEFTYKLGHPDPVNYPPSIALAQAAEKVKVDSNGRLEIPVFPDNQLGGSSEMLTQLRAGAIQFNRQIYGTIAQVVPACGIDALPYIYENSAQAWQARDGAMGNYMRSAMLKMNMYAFEKSWDFGFRQVFNSVRAVNTPDDIKGLKLRVPPDQVEVAFFRAVGASPTPMNVNELYTSIQTHILDGGELPLGPIQSRKMQEVCKYLSITNHISTGLALLANLESWQKLPKPLQDICNRNFNAAAVSSRNDMVKADSALEGALRTAGMTVNHADIPSFKAAVRKAGLYAQWKKDFGAAEWGQLERVTGPLA